MIRDRLLEKHAEAPFLEDYEVKAMEKCKFSQNWGIKQAKENGWKSRTLHGEAASVDVDKATPEIDRICTLIAEYDLDHVYNMDETGLFYKCLPNRSYVKKEDYKHARGYKLMKAKNRTTVYVCTNASGTDKVPLSIIGTAKTPRCFVGRTKKLQYFNQKKAWSDRKTFHKWWNFFLRHIRRRTTKKVLLILDNCGPHGDELIDPRGQVTVIFLPPNCTSMFQPMDAGVIAMLKKNYRYILLHKMLETYDERLMLREQSKGMQSGTMGLSEGHPPHLRDVMDILHQVWEDIDPAAVNNCWVKSQLIGGKEKETAAAASASAANTTATALDSTEQPATTTNDAAVSEPPAADTTDVAMTGNDDDEDEELNALYELAARFAKDKRDIVSCTGDVMTDYDIMMNEMVVTLNNTSSDDKMAMMKGWLEMEDSKLCKDVQVEEANEILENVDLLIDFGDDDDEDVTEDTDQQPPAPKVDPQPERLDEIAELLKKCSIEMDSYNGRDFGPIAEALNDVSDKVRSSKRLFTSKKLDDKIQRNKYRQPNVQPYFTTTQKKNESVATAPSAEEKEQEKVIQHADYKRHENAYFLLNCCDKSKRDQSESGLDVAKAVLDAVIEIRKSNDDDCDDEDQDEDGHGSKYDTIILKHLGRLKRRDFNLLFDLGAEITLLVEDKTLDHEILEFTWIHEFRVL